MDVRPIVFEILREMPGEAADLALVDGLLEVSPESQSDVIRVLLDRNNDSGLKYLPPVFYKLTPSAQGLIISNTSRLFGAMRACMRNSSSQTRQCTLDIIRRSGNPRLAYLAAHAIHDGSPKIRASAAATLLSLTQHHCETRGTTLKSLGEAIDADTSLNFTVSKTLELLGDERRYLVTSLREALNHYESHYRPEVLEASMLIADELESSLFEQSTVKRGKLTHAMIEVVTDWLSPRYVPFLYVAIPCPELRRRIVPRVSNCRDAEFFIEFIRWHWLARDPAIRKHLVSIRSIAWLNDGFEAIFNLPADVASMAPAWILSLGLPSNQKVSLLMHLLVVDNARANRAAAWALVDIKTPASTVALESLLDHEESSVHLVVKRELEHRRRTGQHPRQKKTVKGRPEEWVNLLDRADITEDFDDFWQHFEHIHPAQAQAAGHYVFKYVPGFMTQVQIKLLSQKPADRLRSLRMIMVLCISEHFQRDVFAIANDKLPEIRAAAMAALGQIGGETARRILQRALSDDTPTVQATGIDALDAMQARGRDEWITPLTQSSDADVRAAAVRCLLRMRVPQAAVELMSMLTDASADHRCAALWVADRLKLYTLASRIQTMSRSDPDRRIARIASHVARRLNRASAGATQHGLSGVPS